MSHFFSGGHTFLSRLAIRIWWYKLQVDNSHKITKDRILCVRSTQELMNVRDVNIFPAHYLDMVPHCTDGFAHPPRGTTVHQRLVRDWYKCVS